MGHELRREFWRTLHLLEAPAGRFRCGCRLYAELRCPDYATYLRILVPTHAPPLTPESPVLIVPICLMHFIFYQSFFDRDGDPSVW